MRRSVIGCAAAALALAACFVTPTVARALPAQYDPNSVQPMYRLYNRYTGEHFYTASSSERNSLTKSGWTAEGTGWLAPKVTEANKSSYAPVYRLYNPYTSGGDHHYTLGKSEYDALEKNGWRGEGIAWYSFSSSYGTSLHRLYNPHAQTGTHHYTMATSEKDSLVRSGWKYESSAWNGLPAGLVTAYAQLGKPYEYGASGPSAFDCSGFIAYCYGSARGRMTSEIIRSLKATGDWTTDINKLKVGDLAFTSAGHVGIYVGNRRYIEASSTSGKIVVEYMYSFYGGGSYY